MASPAGFLFPATARPAYGFPWTAALPDERYHLAAPSPADPWLWPPDPTAGEPRLDKSRQWSIRPRRNTHPEPGSSRRGASLQESMPVRRSILSRRPTIHARIVRPPTSRSGMLGFGSGIYGSLTGNALTGSLVGHTGLACSVFAGRQGGDTGSARTDTREPGAILTTLMSGDIPLSGGLLLGGSLQTAGNPGCDLGPLHLGKGLAKNTRGLKTTPTAIGARTVTIPFDEGHKDLALEALGVRHLSWGKR